MDDQALDLRPIDHDLAFQPVVRERPQRLVVEGIKLAPQETDGGRRHKGAGHRLLEPLKFDPPPLARQPVMAAARHRHGREEEAEQPQQPVEQPFTEGQAIAPASEARSLRRSAFSTVSTMCGALRPASSYCFCGDSWS